MNVTTLALSLALGMGVVVGQTPVRRPSGLSPAQPNTDSTPAKKPGSVEGVVTNSVSHEPVKKANVSLRNPAQRFSYAASTDAAGHFLFDNVEPGSYQVSADRDGFTAPRQPRRSLFDSKPVVVDEEQHVKEVAVQLMPLGLVSGHVLDEDGEPIAGATVQAMRYYYNQGRKQLRSSRSANSNDLGEFQLIDVEPARYYFQVTARTRSFVPPHTHGARPEETYAPVYYPSATDLAQAKPQEVTAGGHLPGIDFRLHKTPAYHVRGKVVDGQTGQPARNTMVRLLWGDQTMFSPNRFAAPVQQDGAFDVGGVSMGSYTAMADRAEGQRRTSARQTVSVADQDIEGVVLALLPGLEISGTISVEGPPASASQSQQQSGQTNRQHRVMLLSLEQMGFMSQAMVENDGSFVLHGVARDVYRVTTLIGQPGNYVKSIRFGDQDAPSGQIDLTQQSGGVLHIVLGTDGGQIQGTVQDRSGKPAPGVMVTLAPREEYADRRDLFQQTFSNQNGSFQLHDIAPGEYKVFAWEDTDMNMVQAAEFRKPFESKAVAVSIGPNGKESIQLIAIAAEDIEAEKSKIP